MVETLFEKRAQWLEKDGPYPETVVSSHCRLSRNLADFPFPVCLTESESRSVEKRLVQAIERAGLLDSGQYYDVDALGMYEARVLVERQLIPRDLLITSQARGVYVADDQSLSIVVNGIDHVCIHAIGAGLQVEEVWARVNAVDDELAETVDFAYDARLGYLTSFANQVGTGLKATVELHLPALMNSDDPLARDFAGAQSYITLYSQRYVAEDLYGKQSDFYRLSNWSTLGQSEAEIVFYLSHAASEIAKREAEFREMAKVEGARYLEDRVSRALGVARSARLLEFREGISLLSSLRLGAATGMLPESLHKIDELLIASQRAHLLLHVGHECDDLALNAERADLFRKRFS